MLSSHRVRIHHVPRFGLQCVSFRCFAFDIQVRILMRTTSIDWTRWKCKNNNVKQFGVIYDFFRIKQFLDSSVSTPPNQNTWQNSHLALIRQWRALTNFPPWPRNQSRIGMTQPLLSSENCQGSKLSHHFPHSFFYVLFYTFLDRENRQSEVKSR